MRWLLVFSRGVDVLNAALGRVGNWLVLLAVLISAGNAASRYVFSLSSNAFIEIQWYFFAGIVLLGASYTLRQNGHVRVDVLYSALPPRARLYIDIFGLVVFLLPAMAFFTWLSLPVFLRFFRSGEMSSNYGGLIRWPVVLLIPTGFALLTLQGLSELIKRVAALSGTASVDTSYERPLQ